MCSFFRLLTTKSGVNACWIKVSAIGKSIHKLWRADRISKAMEQSMKMWYFVSCLALHKGHRREPTLTPMRSRLDRVGNLPNRALQTSKLAFPGANLFQAVLSGPLVRILASIILLREEIVNLSSSSSLQLHFWFYHRNMFTRWNVLMIKVQDASD